MRLRRTLCCLALIMFSAATAESQTAAVALGMLRGVVRDTLGQSIDLVEVTAVLDGVRRTRTDSAGAFLFINLPLGLYEVFFRRLGFVPARFVLVVTAGSSPPVHVVLTPTTQLLDSVIVSGRSVSGALQHTGFYERQRQREVGAGTGTFITPEDIQARHALHTTQLLQDVRGLHLRAEHTDFVVPWGRSRVCIMAVFIDGIEISNIYNIRRSNVMGQNTVTIDGPGLNRFISPSDIKAIEVYESGSSTPLQFQSTKDAQCGSIVIWTKVD